MYEARSLLWIPRLCLPAWRRGTGTSGRCYCTHLHSGSSNANSSPHICMGLFTPESSPGTQCIYSHVSQRVILGNSGTSVHLDGPVSYFADGFGGSHFDHGNLQKQDRKRMFFSRNVQSVSGFDRIGISL